MNINDKEEKLTFYQQNEKKKLYNEIIDKNSNKAKLKEINEKENIHNKNKNNNIENKYTQIFPELSELSKENISNKNTKEIRKLNIGNCF